MHVARVTKAPVVVCMCLQVVDACWLYFMTLCTAMFICWSASDGYLCLTKAIAETPLLQPSLPFTPAVPGTLQRVPQMGEVFYSANGELCTSSTAVHACT